MTDMKSPENGRRNIPVPIPPVMLPMKQSDRLIHKLYMVIFSRNGYFDVKHSALSGCGAKKELGWQITNTVKSSTNFRKIFPPVGIKLASGCRVRLNWLGVSVPPECRCSGLCASCSHLES